MEVGPLTNSSHCSLVFLAIHRRGSLLVKSHSVEALVQHPQREQEPRRVQACQKGLLRVADVEREIAVLTKVQGGEAGQDRGNNMG